MNIRALTSWLVSGRRTKPVTTIVLHATAGSSLSGALSALRSRELSYHYLIEKSGAITKAVLTGRVAWHAGKSHGPQGAGVNAYSIGISLVNLNNGLDPYTREQLESVRLLCSSLLAAIPSIRWLTTHYAISPGRKTDPKRYPVRQLWIDLKGTFYRLELWLG